MNILESCRILNPKNIEDECSKFTIDDIESSFILSEIIQLDTRYTLSFWIKSDVSSTIRVAGSTFATSGEWKKHFVVFTSTSKSLAIRFSNVGTYYIYHPKLEIGNTVSDWTPAPEDTGDIIIDTANDIRADMAQREADLTKSYDDVLSNTLDNYVAKDEYSSFKKDVEAKFEVLDGEIAMTFDDVNSGMTELDEATNAKFAEFYKHIVFSDTGIVISSGNSTITLEIDNENGIIFKNNGEPIGLWDGDDFYTGNIVVRTNERAQFGNFAFVPRNDGSLSFLKVGEMTNGG